MYIHIYTYEYTCNNKIMSYGGWTWEELGVGEKVEGVLLSKFPKNNYIRE